MSTTTQYFMHNNTYLVAKMQGGHPCVNCMILCQLIVYLQDVGIADQQKA